MVQSFCTRRCWVESIIICMRGYYIIFGIAIERWRATYVTAISGGAFWRGILEPIFQKTLCGGVLIKSLLMRARSLRGVIAWMASSGLPSRIGRFLWTVPSGSLSSIQLLAPWEHRFPPTYTMTSKIGASDLPFLEAPFLELIIYCTYDRIGDLSWSKSATLSWKSSATVYNQITQSSPKISQLLLASIEIVKIILWPIASSNYWLRNSCYIHNASLTQ
jgi:hypothetical protein